MDHTVDALATFLTLTIVLHAQQMGMGIYAWLYTIPAILTFYTQNLEDHYLNRDKTNFGEIFGPTEAVMLYIGSLLLSVQTGGNFWKLSLGEMTSL